MAMLRRMLEAIAILSVVQAADAGHDVNNTLSVAVDPQSPEILYAATDAGVLKSTNGGSSWTSAGLSTTHVWGITVDPHTPSTLYAWSYDTAGLYKSINGGASWQAVPGLESTYVVAFAIDPSASNTLYVGEAAGILKSNDGGASWTLTGGPDVRSLAINPISPNIVYAGTAALGLFVSVDRGETWTALPDENFILDGPTISTLAIHPATPATMYAGNNTADWCCIDGIAGFEYAQGGAIFKSLDAGVTWQPTSMETYWFSRVQAIAVDPRTGAVYAVRDSELYKSIDGGVTWPAIPPLPGRQMSVGGVALDPSSDPTVIYAATVVGVLKSTDGGQSWTATGSSPSSDTSPPDTALTSVRDGTGTALANEAVTLATSVTFSFSGTDDVGLARFECRIDGVDFGTCTSPASYNGLALGGHTFEVRALDTSDNVDPTPARFTWTVDAAPDTAITAALDNRGKPILNGATTSSKTITFHFTGSDNGTISGVECRLDNGTFKACASPITYSVSRGQHTFRVQAIDNNGFRDGSAATFSWTKK